MCIQKRLLQISTGQQIYPPNVEYEYFMKKNTTRESINDAPIYALMLSIEGLNKNQSKIRWLTC